MSRLGGQVPAFRTSLYADDVAIFVNPVRDEVAALRQILRAFGDATGLHVNFLKSTIMPIHREKFDVDSVAGPLGAPCKPFPCKFLGLPLSLRRLRKVDLQPLLDKLMARLACWKFKMFAAAGRLVLLNAVLSAFTIYSMSVHVLPTWVRRQIDKIRRAWLWRG